MVEVEGDLLLGQLEDGGDHSIRQLNLKTGGEWLKSNRLSGYLINVRSSQAFHNEVHGDEEWYHTLMPSLSPSAPWPSLGKDMTMEGSVSPYASIGGMRLLRDSPTARPVTAVSIPLITWDRAWERP